MDKRHKLDTINSYSHKHEDLVKEAKKALKGTPKEKYKMKVFLPSGKVFAELRASNKKKLENSHKTFGGAYPDHVFTYGEIKTIKVK